MSEVQAPKRVYCVRHQVMKDVEEHAACPYCFGKSCPQIEGGEHPKFCDYDPEKDPTDYGFPEDLPRCR